MNIYTQAYCHIEYLPELRCLVQSWRGFAKSAEFRDAILKTVAFFETSGKAAYIISNTQQSEVVKKEDAEWVATYANPRLVEHGLQKIAFIVPTSILVKWSVNHFRAQSEEKPEIQWFDDIEQAKNWIRNI